MQITDYFSLIFSFVAIVVSGVTLYYQHFKIELVPYAKNENGMFFLIIENNSTNLAKDYTMKIEVKVANDEIKEFFTTMPLTTGQSRFNLAPKKNLKLFVDSHIEAYMDDIEKYPSFLITFYDAKRKERGKFNVDFSIMINNRFLDSENEKLIKALNNRLGDLDSTIKNFKNN